VQILEISLQINIGSVVARLVLTDNLKSTAQCRATITEQARTPLHQQVRGVFSFNISKGGMGGIVVFAGKLIFIMNCLQSNFLCTKEFW
jgi:hypothetical protein